jgi:hypothetical protein
MNHNMEHFLKCITHFITVNKGKYFLIYSYRGDYSYQSCSEPFQKLGKLTIVSRL